MDSSDFEYIPQTETTCHSHCFGSGGSLRGWGRGDSRGQGSAGGHSPSCGHSASHGRGLPRSDATPEPTYESDDSTGTDRSCLSLRHYCFVHLLDLPLPTPGVCGWLGA
ncbi:hypothetical protein E2562_037365 [Oryza meyeriana var. granulata]|uniref:Uncharacterized protein n=1 Tax=Oryza meyeriana var. granulata TaxID=110450 RepID=A0A6G1ETT3_9ORYZ|nr:hypothetical protein E2562_037365 [Oryza meyeriana var. granulata]